MPVELDSNLPLPYPLVESNGGGGKPPKKTAVGMGGDDDYFAEEDLTSLSVQKFLDSSKETGLVVNSGKLSEPPTSDIIRTERLTTAEYILIRPPLRYVVPASIVGYGCLQLVHSIVG